MNWVRSKIDANGIKTLYPPQPKWEQIPTCDMCKAKTQFLHFFPEILALIKPDEKVPLFCDSFCAARFVLILKKGR